MDKRKKNIYLISMAIILWILVILRIFKFVDPSPHAYQNTDIAKLKEMIELKVDTFKLHMSYEDPFAVKRSKKVKVAKPRPIIKKEINKVRKQLINKWPEINYLARVNNKRSLENLVLLQINAKEYIYSINQEIDGIKLLKIYPDSLLLEFNNSQKTFYKDE